MLTGLLLQIFPHIYNWSTFGICCTLERIYEINKPFITSGTPVSPFYVEMVAVLERTLNFMHTGSTKVLMRSLMDGLWLSQGIVVDGFPAFHPRLAGLLSLESPQSPLDVIQSVWPRHSLGEPMEASKCAQIFSYGQRQWEVSEMGSEERLRGLISSQCYFDRFRMFYAIQNISREKGAIEFFPELVHRPDDLKAKFLMMATIVVQAFVRDVVSEAASWITKKIAEEARTLPSAFGDPKITKDYRSRQLKLWTTSSHPLDLSIETTRRMVNAMVHEPDRDQNRLPPCATEFTLKRLASAFHTMALDPRMVTMPFSKDFSSRSLLPVAYKWFVANCDNPSDTARLSTRFRVFVTLALINQKVQRIPAQMAGSRSQNDYGLWIEVPSSNKEQNAATKDLNTEEFVPLANEDELLKRQPWSTLECKLRDLHRVINRTTTPTNIDMRLVKPGTTPYVKKTYEWVMTNFDVEDPVCHYALLVAMVASKTSDKLRQNSTVPPELDNYELETRQQADPATLTKFLRDTEWLEVGSGGGTSKKGRMDEGANVIMFLVYFVGLLHRESPLRERMFQHGGAIGDDWTKKHSAFTFVSRCREPSDIRVFKA